MSKEAGRQSQKGWESTAEIAVKNLAARFLTSGSINLTPSPATGEINFAPMYYEGAVMFHLYLPFFLHERKNRLTCTHELKTFTTFTLVNIAFTLHDINAPLRAKHARGARTCRPL